MPGMVGAITFVTLIRRIFQIHMTCNFKRNQNGAGTFEYILMTAIAIALAVVLNKGLGPGPVKLYEKFCDLVAGDSGRSVGLPANIK